MSLFARTVATLTLARTIVGHPVVQAGIALAPLLLSPQVKAAAKEATLEGAYRAGALARKVVTLAQRR